MDQLLLLTLCDHEFDDENKAITYLAAGEVKQKDNMRKIEITALHACH